MTAQLFDSLDRRELGFTAMRRHDTGARRHMRGRLLIPDTAQPDSAQLDTAQVERPTYHAGVYTR